jgi:hypothetical protein
MVRCRILTAGLAVCVLALTGFANRVGAQDFDGITIIELADDGDC